MIAYIQALKECLIEGYIGIIFGVKVAQDTSILDLYVNDIFQYLETLCSGDLNFPEDFLKSVVGLIGDLSDLYKKRIQSVVSRPFVQRVIGVLEKHTLKEYKTVAQWARSCVMKSLQ